MRVKLDENVSVLVAAPLRALGHDVDSVFDEGLSGAASRRAVEERVVALFEGAEVEAWHGCVVVASDHKVRVARPRSPG